MSLSKEEHDQLMQILTNRRYSAIRLQNKRQEEVESRIPAFHSYREKISELSVKEAEARLRHRTQEAAELKTERQLLLQKKQSILKKAGYPENYLEPQFVCPICQDTGYTGNQKCGCLKQLESELLNREAGLPAMMERENFSTFNRNIYDDTEEIEELRPHSITQYEYMTGSVIGQIVRYVREFETEGSHNILMFGPAGTGKTFLSNCIARALIEKQHTVLYERAEEMFTRMTKAAFSRETDPAAEERLHRIEVCELLIIDDLGTEFQTDLTRAKFFSVISNRLTCGLSTIISTNLSMNQIRTTYGERLSSRFMGEYQVIPFYGADLRVRKNRGV